MLIIVGGLLGLFPGASQFLILRRHFFRSGWWIFLSMAGGAAIMLTDSYLASFYRGQPSIARIFGREMNTDIFFRFAIAGLLYGVLTAIALFGILKRQREPTESDRSSAAPCHQPSTTES